MKELSNNIPSNNKPIGVFDSGVGGLTVSKEISKLLPNEKVVYVGDNGFFPYGQKTQQQIRDRVVMICQWLYDYGCKAVVIACNTATAAGLEAAQKALEDKIPIIGVIKPGSTAAAKATKIHNIGILATQATVDSHCYRDTIRDIYIDTDHELQIVEVGAPDLVELVENKIAMSDSTADVKYDEEDFSIAQKYCKEFIESKSDTVVMACTHFPIVEELLAQTLGPNVKLVSPSYETAIHLEIVLMKDGLINHKDNSESTSENSDKYTFYISGFNDDTEEKFNNICKVLYGYVPGKVKPVNFE